MAIIWKLLWLKILHPKASIRLDCDFHNKNMSDTVGIMIDILPTDIEYQFGTIMIHKKFED